MHLVISAALQQALSAIEKGAEERLEVLKTKKSQLERGESSGDTIPRLIGHIEKTEPEDDDGDKLAGGAEESVAGCGQMAGKGTAEQVGGEQTANKGTEKEKQTGGGQMAGDDGDDGGGTKKAEESEPRKKRSTQSVIKLCEKKWQSMIKQQKHDTISTEVDLEDAMMTPEEGDKKDEEKEKTE